MIVGAAAAAVLIGLGAADLVIARRKGGARAAAAETQNAAVSDADLMMPARTKGDPQAPILIYEISDFQCPYCRQFWAETLPKLDQEYIQTGKVRLIFINFPISQLHPNAQGAHVLAMCAAAQSRFWPMHDLLYAHQPDWAQLRDPTAYFTGLADSAGLSGSTLKTCLAAGRMRDLVAAEAEASWNQGVKSTPSFVVQGVLLAGTAPIENWRPILDSLYKARTTTR